MSHDDTFENVQAQLRQVMSEVSGKGCDRIAAVYQSVIVRYIGDNAPCAFGRSCARHSTAVGVFGPLPDVRGGDVGRQQLLGGHFKQAPEAEIALSGGRIIYENISAHFSHFNVLVFFVALDTR